MFHICRRVQGLGGPVYGVCRHSGVRDDLLKILCLHEVDTVSCQRLLYLLDALQVREFVSAQLNYLNSL